MSVIVPVKTITIGQKKSESDANEREKETNVILHEIKITAFCENNTEK